MGLFAPAGREKGAQLKRQLASAAIAATRGIKGVDARAQFICAEPLIQVTRYSHEPDGIMTAEASRLSQFEALDMLLGNLAPELGGGPELIDVIGLNYYPDNQWYFGGSFIPLGHFAYRPSQYASGGVRAISKATNHCGDWRRWISPGRLAPLRHFRGSSGSA